MMQCSDLSAPKAAKGFVKPTMSEVQPKRGKTIMYQASEKSRAWAGDTGVCVCVCVCVCACVCVCMCMHVCVCVCREFRM